MTTPATPTSPLQALRRYGWLVVVCALVGGGAAAAAAALAPLNHRASAVVRVVPILPPGEAFSDIDPRGFQEVERFYRTQAQLAQRRDFLARAVADVEPAPATEGVYIEAAPLARSQLLSITAVGRDADALVAIADVAAQRFVDEHRAGPRTGPLADATDRELRREESKLKAEFPSLMDADPLAAVRVKTQRFRSAKALSEALQSQRDTPGDPEGEAALGRLVAEADAEMRELDAAHDRLVEIQSERAQRARRQDSAEVVDGAVLQRAAVGPRVSLSGAAGAVLGALIALSLLAVRRSLLPAAADIPSGEAGDHEAAK